jgi:tRNA(adenine34) deaminase
MDTDHLTYMQQALDQAKHALAQNEFPVGCVIVYNNEIVATGARQRSQEANEMDHAEILTLRSLINNRPDINPTDVTLYATLEPCLMCYATMIISGVRRIVYAYEDAMGGGTDLDLTTLPYLYKEMDIEITPFVLRKASLALFKDFFNNSNNAYLQDTMLAEYTRDQPI